MSCYITQCLHCQTRFRITAEQLAVAQGKVRCGACQQVFDAYQQLQPYPAPVLSDPLSTPEPQQAPTPDELAPNTTSAEQIDTESDPFNDPDFVLPFDVDLDEIDLDAELALVQQQEQEWLQRQTTVNTADEPRYSDTGIEIAPHDADETPFEFSEEFQQLPDTTTPYAENKETLSTTNSSTTKAKASSAGLSALLIDPPEIEPAFNTTELSADTHQDRHLRAEATPPSLNIIDDPLQLDWKKPRRAWKRTFFWLTLNFIALAALLGQYLYFNANDLMHQERYRASFEVICPVLQCEVPPRVDISRVQSSNLVVRSHPSYAGALAVDAIIYNRADFAQPFPLLELKFSDINNQPVSSRNFRPTEYLSGELAGSTSMPPQTPIHISLEILDPGDKAVNYTLGFNSP